MRKETAQEVVAGIKEKASVPENAMQDKTGIVHKLRTVTRKKSWNGARKTS